MFAHNKKAVAIFALLLTSAALPAQSPMPDVGAPSTGVYCETATNSGTNGRVYGSLDYLLFGFRDGPAPPLIQSLPSSAFMTGGAVDASQAQTVFGNGIKYGDINGIRGEAGFWFNDSVAFEGVYSQFERKTSIYDIASPGSPSIGRFYIDTVNSAAPITYLIYSRPGGPESGYIHAESPVRLWQAEANVRAHAPALFADRCDWILGFRYLDLRDSIIVNDYVQYNNGSGVAFTGFDSFAARNQFYGPQVGTSSFIKLGGGLTLDVTGKIAMGGVNQQAVVNGSTTQTVNGVVTAVVPGDVLTQSTNIGSYERTRFGVVSELLFKFGYQVGDRCNLSVGYNIIALSSVVRAGSTIDYGVNPNTSPFLPAGAGSTDRRPAFAFNGTDFWAQGLTVGVTLNY